ncbi:hypothetical protein D3C76_999500 [compost metagenome]
MLAHALAVVARGFNPRHQAVDLREQAFGGHRPPIRRTHVLDDGVDHLAPAFLNDQALVALLLGADVTDTKIEHVPDHGQVRYITIAVLGGRRLQGLCAGAHTLAAGGVDVVAAHVSGVQRHARQHVETGEVELTLGQGLLHDFQPAFEVVLHRTGHGLVQGQWAAKRLLPLVHALQVTFGPLLTDTAFDRLTGDCASADRQCQQAGAE